MLKKLLQLLLFTGIVFSGMPAAAAWECTKDKDGKSSGTITSGSILSKNIWAFYKIGGALQGLLPDGTEMPCLKTRYPDSPICDNLPGVLWVDKFDPWEVKVGPLGAGSRMVLIYFPLPWSNEDESSAPADLIDQMTVGRQMTLAIPLARSAGKTMWKRSMTHFELSLKGFSRAMKECKNTATDTAGEKRKN